MENYYKNKYNKYKFKYYNLVGGIRCHPSFDTTKIDDLKFNYIDKFQKIKIKDSEIIDITFKNEPLGKGSSGKVYKGIYTTSKIISKQDIAIKEIPNHLTDTISLCNELNSLQQIVHPNVIKYYGYSEIKTTYYIFMEFIDGPDLFEYITSYKNDDINNNIIARQLLDGLHHLHLNKIYHRDIKPENIMLGEVAKYIDFGFSCIIDKTCDIVSPYQGSPNYISPELLIFQHEQLHNVAAKVAKVSYDPNLFACCDMWALGCTLFMLFARRMFIDPGSEDIYSFIRTLKQDYVYDRIYEHLKDKVIDDNILSAIQNLLQVDHKKRRINIIK
jgi:serine/threonine protein kinase